MGRAKRALAAAAILAALAAASIATAPRAAAEGGELHGDLPVAGGVALVSWSGGPAGALAEAARSRGCNVRSVYANAPGGGFVGYVPGANVAAANRAFLAAYPAGLPASPVLVVCGEPALPRIVFLGDVAGERRAAIRGEVASVVRFYAERFGVVVPESTLYVSPDARAVATAFRELTGREYPVFTGVGGTVTDTPDAGILVFVSGLLVNNSDGFRRVMAHEYYHAIQYHILLAGGESYTLPNWLLEGTATYGEYLYSTAHAGIDQEETRLVYNPQASFSDVASSFGIEHYEEAAAAIDWLVGESGNPRSHIEYWQTLTSEENWADAFAAVFGITVEDFIDAFDEYRAESAKGWHRVRGRVVDLEGMPIPRVQVMLDPGGGGPLSHDFIAITNDAGKFTFTVPEDAYGLFVAQWSTRVFSLAYDPDLGYANTCGAEPVVIDGTLDIEVKVMRELLQRPIFPPCNEGVPGFHVVHGVVFGPDGERYRGAGVMALLYGALRDSITIMAVEIGKPLDYLSFVDVEADGTFAIAVPEGVPFVLQIQAVDINFNSRPIGWQGAGGFTTDPGEATRFKVRDTGIRGIEVRLPADPADLPQIGLLSP